MLEQEKWDIKKVPIYFVFGGHDSRHTSLLEFLRQRMKDTFQSNPSGKIVYFKEDSLQYLEGAAINFELVQRGWLPSAADAQLHPTNPKKDVFHDRQLAILDEFAKEFPGRLLVASEWNPKEELEEVRNGKYKNTRLDLEMSTSLAFEGDFDKAAVYFRRGVQNLAERVGLRDERMVESVHQIMGNQKPVAAFSYFGSAHTGIFHELQKAGYSISRFFPERESSSYLYDPLTAAVRHYRFFPNKPYSNDYWHKMLVMASIYSYLIQADLFTEQKASSLAWYGYRRASKEQIKSFEQEVKSRGFVEALENP